MIINFISKTLLILSKIIKYQLFHSKKIWNKSFGERLSLALAEIGPVFIKLGQSLSARPDIVGIKTAANLNNLKDVVKNFSEKEVHKIITTELNDKPENLFSDFCYKPIATASIAQIHRATIKNNKNVAVKILRPNIAKIIRKDVKFLILFVHLIKFFYPKIRRLKPLEVIKDFEKNLKIEIDLSMEAANASRLFKNTKNDPESIIPKVYWQYTTKKIFTMDWIDGIPISNIAKIDSMNLCKDKISANLAISFFNQVYRDGFFHGDLHPGNIMVLPDCSIAFIDFGVMGYLDKKTKMYTARILRGFMRKNYSEVARIHFEAGYIPSNESIELFTTACGSIGESIIGKNMSEVSISKLLIQLFKVTELFNMRTQIQLLIFQKNLILIEGVGGMIYPKCNLWSLAEPWMKKWAKTNLKAHKQTMLKLTDIKNNIIKISSIIDNSNKLLIKHTQ
ncbi:2-polyprenylphenol 6-hydroxylase, partial [Candidatus Xenohaliotis californiensis]|uniref:2-polyprenylphenol 6-hydroxylase n=1 Tax=Candidatus Xenohaliotis californiensis TaxID=84677 RepID=UPI0030C7A8A2